MNGKRTLQAISDGPATQNLVLAKALQAEMAKLGANPDAARLITVIRPKLEEARKHVEAAIKGAKAVLTGGAVDPLAASDRLANPDLSG